MSDRAADRAGRGPAESDSTAGDLTADRPTAEQAAAGQAAGGRAADGQAAGGRVKSAAMVVVAAALAAAIVNLLVYAVGRAAGGTFQFTTAGQTAEVNAVTVAGFSALPLAVGLVLVALLARHTWAIKTALVAGPALAVLTILIMTIPADLDTKSTITLAVCHLTLVPILIVAIRRLAARA
jgi:hypothetical protein